MQSITLQQIVIRYCIKQQLSNDDTHLFICDDCRFSFNHHAFHDDREVCNLQNMSLVLLCSDVDDKILSLVQTQSRCHTYIRSVSCVCMTLPSIPSVASTVNQSVNMICSKSSSHNSLLNCLICLFLCNPFNPTI